MGTEPVHQSETMRQVLTEHKKRLLFAFPQVAVKPGASATKGRLAAFAAFSLNGWCSTFLPTRAPADRCIHHSTRRLAARNEPMTTSTRWPRFTASVGFEKAIQ
jgi:hypothetical protein